MSALHKFISRPYWIVLVLLILVSCSGNRSTSSTTSTTPSTTPTPGSGTASSCNTPGCSVTCSTSACSVSCSAENCSATCSADYCSATCTGSSCNSSCTGSSCVSSASGTGSSSSSTGSSSRSSTTGERSSSACSGTGCSSTSDGSRSDSSASGSGSSTSCSGTDCSSSRSDSTTTTTELPPVDSSDPTAPAMVADIFRLVELWYYRVVFNDTAITGSPGTDHICYPPESYLRSENCIAFPGLGESGYACSYFPSARFSAEASQAERESIQTLALEGLSGGDLDPRNGLEIDPCAHHSDDGPSNCRNYQILSPTVTFKTRNIRNIDITCCHFGEGRPEGTGDACASLLGASIPSNFEIPSYRGVTIPADANVSSSSYSLTVTHSEGASEDSSTWTPSTLDGEMILCKAIATSSVTSRTTTLPFFSIPFERTDGLCDEPDLYNYVDADHIGPDGVDYNRFYENR